jgi:5-methylcytosine-specific restriction endonuclease McrA
MCSTICRGASGGITAASPAPASGVAVVSALVLNASFEPLSVVAPRRAACLVLAEKAELVESDGTLMRSASLSLPTPIVIRLRYMVKVPYLRGTTVSRRGVFARDDHRCQYCGAAADSIDHVMPRSRGGAHVWENVAAACRPCNLAKRDRTPDEAGMRLFRPCRAPRSTAWVVVSVARVPDAWKPYLAPAS